MQPGHQPSRIPPSSSTIDGTAKITAYKSLSFPVAGPRPVVAFMQEPAEAMHHPSVRGIGERLHADDGNKE